MTEIIIQLVIAFVGSLGFALVFNAEKRNILPASFGGIFCWGIYLVCIKLNIDIFAASVITAAFCQMYSEILARILKAPTTVFCIPAVVPLIPGSSLYYTMYYAVAGDSRLCADFGFQTVKYTFGIAIGISFVSAVVIILEKIRRNSYGN